MDHEQIRLKTLAYEAEHPDVDWLENELVWEFTGNTDIMRIQGHRLIDLSLKAFVDARMKQCCCHGGECNDA